ncbi:MAG: DUF3244 domain-containing protein [Proteiniphilum sp.]|nr:DUF3244 domain-containing protein [Proteiniphilum sp.]
MKKIMFALFLMITCSALLFQASAQDPVEDKIELSREGGTTRITDINSMMSISSIDPVMVEAFRSRNVVTISVENYRGGAWIEITGEGGARHSYFEVYDMGFEVIHLSGLRAGKYNIRITLDSGVYSGTFKKGKYGNR